MTSPTAAAVVILAVILAGAAGWYILTYKKTTQLGGEGNIWIELGQTAPDFTLQNIDGVSFTLSGYRGNIVGIDFMATWCGLCMLKMGHLKQLFTNYSAQWVVIMSIDVDPSETNETIRQFKERYGDNWAFVSGLTLGTTCGVIYIPIIYIIDPEGRIAYKNVGITSYSTPAAEVDKLL